MQLIDAHSDGREVAVPILRGGACFVQLKDSDTVYVPEKHNACSCSQQHDIKPNPYWYNPGNLIHA
jgi:hypothetical protein